MNDKHDTRFRKGQSGNPKGRPRKREPLSSVFSMIFEQKQVVTQNGVERELPVEEALQLRTVQAALSGQPNAVRTVFRWIVKRETWRSSRRTTKKPKPEFMLIRERDSDNAFEAMYLLGIGVHLGDVPGASDPDQRQELYDPPRDYDEITLAAWAIRAAFERTPALRSDADLESRLGMQGIHPDQLDDV